MTISAASRPSNAAIVIGTVRLGVGSSVGAPARNCAKVAR